MSREILIIGKDGEETDSITMRGIADNATDIDIINACNQWCAGLRFKADFIEVDGRKIGEVI